MSGRLLSSRAYALFRLTSALYGFNFKKLPTIFDYIIFLTTLPFYIMLLVRGQTAGKL